MDLLKEYKDYVEWSEVGDTYPIGFIPWKEIKFNFTFNEKKGVWTKNE